MKSQKKIIIRKIRQYQIMYINKYIYIILFIYLNKKEDGINNKRCMQVSCQLSILFNKLANQYIKE